ncbi:MAG: glycosyltransferase family 2 protein [Alphaproteobacteria bacterium]|nr:glycosyltransferase family 2 protein [Alphaproteobacteria bacterium]
MGSDMSTGLDLSVVIPLYNEADNLRPLHDALAQALPKTSRTFEIILVNDGSRDGSEELLAEIAASDQTVRVLNLRRNFGQTAAIMAGLDHARGNIIVPLDGDLQNDPEDIPALLDKLEEGYDVVSGWRKNRQDDNRRSFVSRVANRIISMISGVHLHDYGCTLKAYRREVIEGVRLYGEMHRFVPIYATWQGGRVTEIVVNHRPRTAGKSKYGFNRIFKVVFDLMVVQFLMRYDTKPIYVFGLVGAISILISFLGGLAALYLRFFEGTSLIQTPLPLLSALTFLTGVICILMGLMAELLVRVYYESQGKATYLIKRTSDSPDRPDAG